MNSLELAIAQVNSMIQRKQFTMTFFISINTLILSIIGLLLKDSDLTPLPLRIAVLLLLAFALFFCCIWRKLIRTYSRLIGWWYTRIRELETPKAEKLFTREYTELYAGNDRATKLSISRQELFCNVAFLVLHSVAFVFVLLLTIVQRGG